MMTGFQTPTPSALNGIIEDFSYRTKVDSQQLNIGIHLIPRLVIAQEFIFLK